MPDDAERELAEAMSRATGEEFREYHQWVSQLRGNKHADVCIRLADYELARRQRERGGDAN